MAKQKITYQNEEFLVRGSAVANIAVAETADNVKGVFNVKTGHLIDGLFDSEWRVQLYFDKVNNLMIRSAKGGGKERITVAKAVAEPI